DFRQPYYAGEPSSWPSGGNQFAHATPELGYVALSAFLYPGDLESIVDDQGLFRSKRVEAQITAGPLLVGPEDRRVDMHAGYSPIGSITSQVLSFDFSNGVP